MKVLFLDIDGVLNSIAWYEARSVKLFEPPTLMERHLHELDPHACELLHRFCATTGVVVVVSSTWRKIVPLPQIATLLSRATPKFEGREELRIIGATPDLGKHRGFEINAWLKSCPVESFAIVDDDSDMAMHKGRLIQTKHETGLTQEHLPMLAEMLAKPYNQG